MVVLSFAMQTKQASSDLNLIYRLADGDNAADDSCCSTVDRLPLSVQTSADSSQSLVQSAATLSYSSRLQRAVAMVMIGRGSVTFDDTERGQAPARGFPPLHGRASDTSTGDNAPMAAAAAAVGSISGGLSRTAPGRRMTMRPTAVAAAAASAFVIACRTVSQTRRYEQREMRATIRMAIIIAFFCCMWLGFFVAYVVASWCPSTVCPPLPRTLDAFLFWLGYSNSSVNPILYTIFNEDFRRAFQKILGCTGGERHGAGGDDGHRRVSIRSAVL
jgi:hypothetical protein